MAKMPKQKPGESKQDYETPPEFIAAVVRRFGPLTWDLAARVDNRKAPFCYTEQSSSRGSLGMSWHDPRHRGNLWLNPPFGEIAPWAEKCASSLGLRHRIPGMRDRHDWRVLMLVPASVGSEWYGRHVHGLALVMPLRPRITFVGETQGFPKDLMLCIYELQGQVGFEPWRWD